MSYLFVGVQGLDDKGDNVIIQSYFSPDEENIADVLVKAKGLAAELKLNTKAVVGASNGGGSSSNGKGNGNTEVVKVGSFAVRTQRNQNAETKEFTYTPAVVLYPKWNRTGEYGKFSITTAFLNYPEDVTAFEEWLAKNGIDKKLDELPTYNGQNSPMRTFGITENWEIPLPELGDVEVSHTPYTKPDGTDGKRTKLVSWM